MNGPFDEERLSAYHDGELPESERQPVADRFAESPELREVLDEYVELSGSLKSLPRSHAPDDLHGAVMHQVRDAAAVRPGTPSSRPSRRMWLWTAGTAASLLLAVGVIWIVGGGNGDTGMYVADSEQSVESGAAPSAAMTRAAPQGAPTGSARSGPPSEVAADAAETPMPADVDSFANDGQLRRLLRSLSDELEVGQELQVLRGAGDQLELVEFHVVDIVETLGAVDVLLRENRRQPLAGGSVAGQAVHPENRLCGIFLEASHEDLLTAINESELREHVVLVEAVETQRPAEDAQRTAEDGYQAELSMYNDALRSIAARENGQPGQQQERSGNVLELDNERRDDADRGRSRFLIVFIDQDGGR